MQTTREKLVDDHGSLFRWVEIASTLTFITVSGCTLWKIRAYCGQRPDLALSAFFLGWASADFVSGLVHWAGDTWGTTDWFLIGQTLIRTFREHHVDPEAITRHDFIETNGTNCMISLPILFWCAWTAPGWGVIWMFSMVSWVFATNQIHKWAHQPTRPEWVSYLQRSGLILPPEHHAVHHQAPFVRYYCITTGWLNRPLAAIGFFPACEALITFLTRAIPREHDQNVVQSVTANT